MLDWPIVKKVILINWTNIYIKISLQQPKAYHQIDKNFNQNEKGNQIEHLEKLWFVVMMCLLWEKNQVVHFSNSFMLGWKPSSLTQFIKHGLTKLFFGIKHGLRYLFFYIVLERKEKGCWTIGNPCNKKSLRNSRTFCFIITMSNGKMSTRRMLGLFGPYTTPSRLGKWKCVKIWI
jgi:hypothetical protein